MFVTAVLVFNQPLYVTLPHMAGCAGESDGGSASHSAVCPYAYIDMTLEKAVTTIEEVTIGCASQSQLHVQSWLYYLKTDYPPPHTSASAAGMSDLDWLAERSGLADRAQQREVEAQVAQRRTKGGMGAPRVEKKKRRKGS